MVDFNERLLQNKLKREAANARKREDRIVQAVSSGDDSKIANFLRKGEEIAFKDKLRPYQQAAVIETVRNYRTKRHTLNATGVGLGKTRVAASFVNTVSEFKRVLWITSLTILPDTVNEISRNLGASIIPVGDDYALFRTIPFPEPTIFITHYEALKRDAGLWLPNEWDCIVYDECSKLKGGANPRPTQIWKDARDFCNKVHPTAFKLFLSGTPAENRPEEIWSYLHIFQPEKFDSLAQFKAAFCRYNQQGKLVFSTERLLELLQGSVIRQTVENLGLQGMPSMKDPNWYSEVNHEITLPPDSKIGSLYLELQNDLRAALDADNSLTPNMELEQILRLRQILTAGPRFTYTKQLFDLNGNPTEKKKFSVDLEGPFPKLDAAESLIASYQAEGEQVIVFSCFNEPLTNLANALNRTGFYRVGLLTGETDQATRAKLVSDFQHGDVDVILVNKKTGSQGLNLQKRKGQKGGAKFIIHLDRWFNPAVEEQANGRALRMDTIEPVVSTYLHVRNSVDDWMLAMINSKRESVGQMDEGLLRASLEKFTLG
jgi:SNF2 family DNA or RNA helicase